MPPIEIFKLMFILLPMWILQEGIKIFSKFLKAEEGRGDIFLYSLTGFLAILTIVLILQGYPIF